MVQCRTPYSTGYGVVLHTVPYIQGLATYGYSVYRGHDTVHIHGTVPYIQHIRVHTDTPPGLGVASMVVSG